MVKDTTKCKRRLPENDQVQAVKRRVGDNSNATKRNNEGDERIERKKKRKEEEEEEEENELDEEEDKEEEEEESKDNVDMKDNDDDEEKAKEKDDVEEKEKEKMLQQLHKTIKVEDKMLIPGRIPFKFNAIYTDIQYAQFVRHYWIQQSNLMDFRDQKTNFQIQKEPYHLCILPNFLTNPLELLQYEIIHKMKWLYKQMDLYEYQQSIDLSALHYEHTPYICDFLNFLWISIKPWLEFITDMKFNRISASCSMYTGGDHLLVHDDMQDDRAIAFIYYLSPWKEREEWSEEHGGCLEILKHNEKGWPILPPYKRIPPKDNQFIFFEVLKHSYHQVSEVMSFDYPRLSINGWFHSGCGGDDDDVDDYNHKYTENQPKIMNLFQPALILNDDGVQQQQQQSITNINILKKWINPIYLKTQIKDNIQKRMESDSELCLTDYLIPEMYKNLERQLKEDTKLKWKRLGPANMRNYEMLDLNSATDLLLEFVNMLRSVQIFELFQEYTGLDLALPSENPARCYLEVQRWTNGDYTLLSDECMNDDDALDIVFYLNATEGAGNVNYVKVDSGEPTSIRNRVRNSYNYHHNKNNNNNDNSDYDYDDSITEEDEDEEEAEENNENENQVNISAQEPEEEVEQVEEETDGADADNEDNASDSETDHDHIMDDPSPPSPPPPTCVVGGVSSIENATRVAVEEEEESGESLEDGSEPSEPSGSSDNLRIPRKKHYIEDISTNGEKALTAQATLEDALLLSVTPTVNALNMVYYCEGTSKFVKYVSHRTPLPNGPVYIISCCYKE